MKKIIKLFLVFSMILTSLNLGNNHVKANDNIENDIIESVNCENITINTNEEPISLYSNIKKFTSISECANYIRKQLVDRNLNFDFELILNEDDSNIVINDLISEVFKHTGNPKEGDYLNYQYASYVPSGYYTPSTSTYTLNFVFEMYTTLEEEKQVDKKVNEILQSLDLNNKTELEKILAIYDYITSNVVYDYENLYDDTYTKKYTAYAALLNGKSVCQGYSNLFYRLALEAGIDNRIVAGFGDGEAHSWNIVKLGNKYYNIDATWDAGNFNYDWFLKSNQDFIEHIRDEQYLTNEFNNKYPMSNQSYKFNEESGIIDGFEYIANQGKAEIIKYHGNEKEVVVPSMINGNKVVFVGSQAISANHTMEKLIFSEGIEYLGSDAVFFCSNLKEIYIPSTLKLVDSYNPNQQTFNGTNQSFGELFKLENIYIDENNPYAVVKDGVVYSKDMSVLYYVIPNSNVTVLNIPNGVKEISTSACYHNINLTKVIMPDTVEVIGYWAFTGCSNITEFNLSKNCKVILQYALQDIRIKTIHIPKTMELIATPALSIPTLETISADEDGAYYVKDGVLYYENSLVLYPALKKEESYVVNEFVDYIDKAAFERAIHLKYLEINGNVETIETGAFYGCENLETVKIHNGVQVINDSAFFSCMNLKEVYIPSSVTFIGSSVFANDYDVTIFGETGSYAEQYAIRNNINFKTATENKPITSVTLNKNNLELNCWDTYQFIATIHPSDNTSNETLTWTSSNPNIADIHQDGKLYTYGEGTAIITVTTVNGKTDTCTVTIVDKSIKSVTLDKSNAVLEVGNTLQLNATINPTDTTDSKVLTWISSDQSVASVDQNGKVTAKAAGSTIITVTTSNGRDALCIVTVTESQKPDSKPEETGVERIFGDTRYQTAMEVANALKEELGVSKFETVIIATGIDYPDALAGSYLAGKKNAPILMVNERYMDDVANYVKKNVIKGGTVYILGGEKAVSPLLETKLSGYNIERLAGSNRFETNLMILEEAGVTNEDILVCTGYDFADSLSASATERPILLVHPKSGLNAKQIEFLNNVRGNKMYIIGGVNAINDNIFNTVKSYAGTIKRIGGSDRNETSVLIAKEFFNAPTSAVVAYSRGFADGLVGGPLAIAKKAPLILTQPNKTSYAKDYITSNNIKSGNVLGGSKLVSDEDVIDIFNK